jgi:TRAP-type mannitol/chloroaromatic compound transport system permease small subunit
MRRPYLYAPGEPGLEEIHRCCGRRLLNSRPITGEGTVKFLRAYVSKVESISEWSGKIVSFLGLVMVFTITIDVFLRYVFNAPTKWSYDITYMIGGTLLIMPMAYVLMHKGHVSIDILYRRFSPRTALIVNVVLDVLFFFPLMIVIFYMSATRAYSSILVREFSNVGFWRPPLYPFRTMIPVAYFLIVLQGIASFARNVYSLGHGGKEL